MAFAEAWGLPSLSTSAAIDQVARKLSESTFYKSLGFRVLDQEGLCLHTLTGFSCRVRVNQ